MTQYRLTGTREGVEFQAKVDADSEESAEETFMDDVEDSDEFSVVEVEPWG